MSSDNSSNPSKKTNTTDENNNLEQSTSSTDEYSLPVMLPNSLEEPTPTILDGSNNNELDGTGTNNNPDNSTKTEENSPPPKTPKEPA